MCPTLEAAEEGVRVIVGKEGGHVQAFSGSLAGKLRHDPGPSSLSGPILPIGASTQKQHINRPQ